METSISVAGDCCRMSEKTALSPEAVNLLLELLEAPEPVLSARAFELRAAPAAQLVAAGFLVPHDLEEVTTSVGEYDDPPIELTWSEVTGGLSYSVRHPALSPFPRSSFVDGLLRPRRSLRP